MSRLSSFLLVVALCYSEAAAARNPFPSTVTGVVKKVDVEVGTITVRPIRKGAPEEETLSLLKKDIEVTASSGEKARLEAIVPGQTVQLKLSLSGDVEAAVVQAHVFPATVLDVDLKSRTVTVADHPNASRTMAVASDAKIRLGSRPAYLREIKLGSRMNVTASLDGKTAQALSLVSNPDGKPATKLYTKIKTSRLPGIHLAGVLTDVDPAKGQLQLTGPKTKGLPKAMPVAKDAVIQMMYGQVPVQELPLHALMKTAYATVLVSPEAQQVTHMFVETLAVRGTVKALDADGGYLTVEVDGKEKVFALRRDVKVMDKTKVMRLGDLHANMPVNLILSLDREQLLAVDLHRAAQ